ncbi:hypothetical protein CEXT_506181 [Caerostris extrusa]|uniref:Uncharacterized protein n=1 Tax=Caerostris extrusa TaxID=172846 RepID=A0AAV4XDC7_CAEEX|nr:hypothetical protein CEXT_506181 [Caerostris extrusa]
MSNDTELLISVRYRLLSDVLKEAGVEQGSRNSVGHLQDHGVGAGESPESLPIELVEECASPPNAGGVLSKCGDKKYDLILLPHNTGRTYASETKGEKIADGEFSVAIDGAFKRRKAVDQEQDDTHVTYRKRSGYKRLPELHPGPTSTWTKGEMERLF